LIHAPEARYFPGGIIKNLVNKKLKINYEPSNINIIKHTFKNRVTISDGNNHIQGTKSRKHVFLIPTGKGTCST